MGEDETKIYWVSKEALKHIEVHKGYPEVHEDTPMDLISQRRSEIIEDNGARPAKVSRVVVDETLIDADEPSEADDMIYHRLVAHIEKFAAVTGFPLASFLRLYEPFGEALRRPRRGRGHLIGATDSFLLLLHWLRSGSSIEQIAAGFTLRQETLYRRIQETIELAHADLVSRDISRCVEARNDVIPVEKTAEKASGLGMFQRGQNQINGGQRLGESTEHRAGNNEKKTQSPTSRPVQEVENRERFYEVQTTVLRERFISRGTEY
jgi:hypothetical protein